MILDAAHRINLHGKKNSLWTYIIKISTNERKKIEVVNWKGTKSFTHNAMNEEYTHITFWAILSVFRVSVSRSSDPSCTTVVQIYTKYAMPIEFCLCCFVSFIQRTIHGILVWIFETLCLATRKRGISMRCAIVNIHCADECPFLRDTKNCIICTKKVQKSIYLVRGKSIVTNL